MKEILSIKDIVSSIPILLEYLVPGFLFLSIRNFSFSKDETKDKYILVKSVVISFVFLQIIYPLTKLILSPFGLGVNALRYIYIVFILVISVLYIKFDVEQYLISFLGTGKTTKNECFDIFINRKAGATARIYIESEEVIYVGSIIYYDDKLSGEDRRIVLAGYTTYSYDADVLDDYVGDKNKLVVLNMKDIKRIEVFK